MEILGWTRLGLVIGHGTRSFSRLVSKGTEYRDFSFRQFRPKISTIMTGILTVSTYRKIMVKNVLKRHFWWVKKFGFLDPFTRAGRKALVGTRVFRTRFLIWTRPRRRAAPCPSIYDTLAHGSRAYVAGPGTVRTSWGISRSDRFGGSSFPTNVNSAKI